MAMKYGGMLLEKEEREAINRVLERNWWTLAQEGSAFESELTQVAQVKDTIFVNSGSSALLLAFEALPKYKKEVIIPATLFPTAVTAIKKAGLIPVVVDSRPETLCINEDEVDKAVNENTLAILDVHVAGYMPDIERLRKHDCLLIIDNCDGFGGKWKDKPVESYADISVTSFHAAHIISTGQGGAVFCNDKEISKRVREIRDWGRMSNFDDEKEGIAPLPKDFQQRYTYIRDGYNLSPIEMQAAIGREQLKKLERFKKARSVNHKYLSERIKYDTPKSTENSDPVYFTLPILSDKRPEILKRLRENKIEYRNILAGNIRLHPAFNDLKVIGELKGSQDIAERGFWISVHPSLKKEEMDNALSVI